MTTPTPATTTAAAATTTIAAAATAAAAAAADAASCMSPYTPHYHDSEGFEYMRSCRIVSSTVGCLGMDYHGTTVGTQRPNQAIK